MYYFIPQAWYVRIDKKTPRSKLQPVFLSRQHELNSKFGKPLGRFD